MRKVFEKVNFNFMRWRWVFISISLALIAFGIFTWNKVGTNKYSVDFLGGTELIVKFEGSADPGQIRTKLETSGLQGVTVQAFEKNSNEYTVRLRGDSSQDVANKVKASLKEVNGKEIQILKQDYVGPIIGEKIMKDALIALVLSIIIISVYVTVRFEWAFALGAGLALLHDVLITAGVFVFIGGEVGASFLAAVLTIVGYSINDTIIVFDRVRENILASKTKEIGKKIFNGKSLSSMSLSELMNLSVNQTLSRTVLTNLTVFIVIIALVQYGGGALSDLANSLFIGAIVGTYSSIFIACPTVLAFSRE